MNGHESEPANDVSSHANARRASTDHAAEGDGYDELVGFVRGSGLNLAGAVFSQLSLLLTSLVLARWLGPGDLGVYWQSYALLSLLGLLSLAGFGAAATRFVAVHRAEGDEGAVRGTIRLARGLTVAISVAVAGTLFALAPWLAESVFDDPRLVGALRLVALALPAMAFLDVTLAATKGFRSMRAFALIGLGFEPGVRVALTAALVWAGAGLSGAMMALVVSNLAAAILAARALRRLTGPGNVRRSYRPREIVGFSLASWMASLATSGLIWVDTLLIGVYLQSSQVGVYNVATRVVLLATFVMLPINAAFAPRVADLYQRGETETLRRTYAYATTWIIRLSLPAFIVLILFPTEVLAIFGPGFSAAAAVTIVLALGKAIDAATGPCAMMLNMSGRPAVNMADNVTALALNIVLNLWLIPRSGILGAAVAWAIALGVVNLARVLQVRWTMGMWPFSDAAGLAVLAGIAAAAVGLAVRGAVPEPSSLIVGTVAIVGTYVAMIVASGLTAEDRALMSRLRATHGTGPPLSSS